MSLTSIIEEYIEAIYTLSSEGRPVIGARLADAIGVSPATVTETVKRMERDGFVSIDPHKEISLTPAGIERAETLVRRHRLSERWLADVLGLEWHKVHDEACKLEHALSDEVEKRLANSLGNPTTCPHGNPIPGAASADLAAAQPLAECSPGRSFVVDRIVADAEKDPRLLAYLRDHGIVPGASLLVKEVVPFDGTVVATTSAGDASLGPRVAGLVWVRPVASSQP